MGQQHLFQLGSGHTRNARTAKDREALGREDVVLECDHSQSKELKQSQDHARP